MEHPEVWVTSRSLKLFLKYYENPLKRVWLKRPLNYIEEDEVRAYRTYVSPHPHRRYPLSGTHHPPTSRCFHSLSNDLHFSLWLTPTRGSAWITSTPFSRLFQVSRTNVADFRTTLYYPPLQLLQRLQPQIRPSLIPHHRCARAPSPERKESPQSMSVLAGIATQRNDRASTPPLRNLTISLVVALQ
jgi:hypothetical protein